MGQILEMMQHWTRSQRRHRKWLSEKNGEANHKACHAILNTVFLCDILKGKIVENGCIVQSS